MRSTLDKQDMRGLTIGLLSMLFGIGAGSLAMKYRHHLDSLHATLPQKVLQPIPHDILIEGNATWAELLPLLLAAGEQGYAYIRVNGGPMYLPCYSPYEEPHQNVGIARYAPQVAMTVSSNTSLEEIDKWLAERELRGTLVRVNPGTAVTRISALARLLDVRRHTAMWATLNDSGAEFLLTEAGVFSAFPVYAVPETVQPSDPPK